MLGHLQVDPMPPGMHGGHINRSGITGDITGYACSLGVFGADEIGSTTPIRTGTAHPLETRLERGSAASRRSGGGVPQMAMEARQPRPENQARTVAGGYGCR